MSTALLKPFTTGQEALTITPGENGFLALVPLDEPISAGTPPTLPDLVDRVTPAMATVATRRVKARSGRAVTSSLETAGRARVPLRWTGMTKAQRDALLAFIRDTMQGRRFGMTVEPDGPGTGTVVVRLVESTEYREVMNGRGGVNNNGVYSLALESEEVF